MAQTFGFMLYVLGLGLESQVLGLGLGLAAYVLGLAICVLDSITDYYPHSEGGIVFSSVRLCVCLSTR